MVWNKAATTRQQCNAMAAVASNVRQMTIKLISRHNHHGKQVDSYMWQCGAHHNIMCHIILQRCLRSRTCRWSDERWKEKKGKLSLDLLKKCYKKGRADGEGEAEGFHNNSSSHVSPYIVFAIAIPTFVRKIGDFFVCLLGLLTDWHLESTIFRPFA